MDNQSPSSRSRTSTSQMAGFTQSSQSTFAPSTADLGHLETHTEDLLQLHQRRQTLGTISSAETLTYSRLVSEWCPHIFLFF